MPSSSLAQARFFAACAHGAGYASCPSEKVSHEFNRADKGSALLSSAMKHRYAAGGEISPLASLAGDPMHMRATLPHLGQPVGSAGRMRMPHVPLADTMHNIDQHMAGARVKLPKLRKGGRAKRFDEGGPVQQPMPDDAINALVRAAQIQVATDPDGVTQDHSHLRALSEYMARRQQLGAAAGPPPRFDEGGRVAGQSSPGSPGFGGAVKDALAALKDYVVDRPRRELAAAREARENAEIGDTSTPTGNYAAGGPVQGGLSESAKGAVKAALAHLTNKDASSAAATLHASPEAMQHPVVRLAAHALRTSTGLAGATQQLAGMGQ